MHADSIPINNATPQYPDAEITAMMNYAIAARIFSLISGEYNRPGPGSRLRSLSTEI
jgi:hypothetical protein